MVNCIYPLGFPIQNSIVLSVEIFPAAAGEISIVSTIKPDASLSYGVCRQASLHRMAYAITGLTDSMTA